MEKTLVVYFSRTGNTRRVAELLARSAAWDLEAIREPRSRDGIVGYLRSAWEASAGRTVPIEKLEHDLARYDLVVVATPVWFASVSSPVRAFFDRYRQALHEVAFVVTCGGRGAERAARQMEALARIRPRRSLLLTARDLSSPGLDERVRRFADGLVPRHEAPRKQPMAR